MQWHELDPNDPPTEYGAYAYVSTREEDNQDGIVYTCLTYENSNIVEQAEEMVGWIPTHYIYLEPVPRVE